MSDSIPPTTDTLDVTTDRYLSPQIPVPVFDELARPLVPQDDRRFTVWMCPLLTRVRATDWYFAGFTFPTLPLPTKAQPWPLFYMSVGQIVTCLSADLTRYLVERVA